MHIFAILINRFCGHNERDNESPKNCFNTAEFNRNTTLNERYNRPPYNLVDIQRDKNRSGNIFIP